MSSSAACATRSIGHSRRNCCTPFAASAMSYEPRSSFGRTFGLRLALWYAVLFAAGRAFLARCRSVLRFAILSIVVSALTGGRLVTQTAVAPLRTLIEPVRRITQTGRTDLRVPGVGTRDAIDELTTLFNSMLDRI